jgi:lipopolysaccharide/colanic/teichoic acid biosynthesis glycosyltransferase
VKRPFDVLIASAMLVASAPVFLVAAVLVKVSSPGPVFYRSTRVGRGGGTFGMVKFRTMFTGADQVGSLVTRTGDPRVTPVGAWLRRTKIDELPTLLNVLAGDMSMVGPRPENPRSASLYTQVQQRLLTVRPGVTSPATIVFRHEEDLLSASTDVDADYFGIMQKKLQIELDYLDRRSLFTDCAVLAGTARAILLVRRVRL